MSKKKVTEAMTLKMNIELADNGIILRNPDNEDEVTLAIRNGEHHEDEYRAIGQTVYDWLIDVVLQEQEPNEIIVTGFQIEVQAKCEGRGMYD